jgi:hypothetical protein
MDKAEFVEKAPMYYGLAIGMVVWGSSGPVTEAQIVADYAIGGGLLKHRLLWDRAVAWLGSLEIIQVVSDPFAPTFYLGGANGTAWQNLRHDTSLPFKGFFLTDNQKEWLELALVGVNNAMRELGVGESDFDVPSGEWSPIQIDQADERVVNAITALSEATEEIRGDNGYAATFPEEREHVIEGLEKGIEKLKSSSVAPGFIRGALDRLKIASKRFEGSSKEVVITGARQALIEFVKAHMSHFLSFLSGLFF